MSFEKMFLDLLKENVDFRNKVKALLSLGEGSNSSSSSTSTEKKELESKCEYPQFFKPTIFTHIGNFASADLESVEKTSFFKTITYHGSGNGWLCFTYEATGELKKLDDYFRAHGVSTKRYEDRIWIDKGFGIVWKLLRDRHVFAPGAKEVVAHFDKLFIK